MLNEIIAGLLALAIPAVIIGSIVLWRTKPVLIMYYSLVLMGLGYLTTTGAVEEVGRQALTYMETRDAAPAAGAPEPAAAVSAPAASAKPAEASPQAAPSSEATAAPASGTASEVSEGGAAPDAKPASDQPSAPAPQGQP